MKTLKQKISFPVPAHNVYDAFMSSKKHSAFTGGKAKISKKIGGKFSVYDGYATGKNLELVHDEKIVQTWHASDWNDDELSEVTFLFTTTKTGCTLFFTQKNIPQRHYASIKQGWIDFYWKPLKEMFKKP